MLAPLIPSLALLTFFGFFALMLITREDKNKTFVKYVLLTYPIIALTIIPGGVGYNNFDLIVWGFTLIFYRPKRVSVTGGLFYLALFILLTGIGIISAIAAESITEETIRTFVEYFALFLFAKITLDEVVEDPYFFFEMLRCLKLTVMIALGFLACQFLFGVEFSLARTLNGAVFLEENSIRYPGYFQDPQKFAQFLAVTSFLFLIREPGTSKLPVKNYLMIVLTLIAILYTGGRAAFGGWALGFALIVLFGNANLKLYATLVGIAMFLIIYNFSESFAVFNRHDDLSDSYEFRANIWRDAFQIFLDHPLLGIAPGNYANYVSVHNPDQFWFVDNDFLYYDHPESGYLKWLTEFGAFGFLAVMLLIIIPMVRSFFYYLRWRDTVFLLLISSILSWMAGFYTVYSMGDVRIQILITTVLCMMIASYKLYEEPLESADEAEEAAAEEQVYAEA